MFGMVIFGLFIIFSSGLGSVSAAQLTTSNTNGSSNAGILVSSNVVNQDINQVKLTVTRPKVNSTDPALNAVNVPTSKTINITFTKPIKLGTNSWIEFKTNKGVSVPFTATVNGNALLIAHSTLAYGESYSVILHGNSVTDLSGIGMTLFSTNFTTIKRPVVITTNPSSNAVNIPTNTVIQIKFNRSIKYVNNSAIQFINSKGTAIPFTSTITGSTLNITPKSLLAHGTQYTIILHSNSVKDLAGNGIIVCSTKFTTIVTTKTFSNYGVTFNYPATWIALPQQPEHGTDFILVLNPADSNRMVSPMAMVQITPNPSDLSDADALAAIKSSASENGFKVLSGKMVKLNGLSAYDTVYIINNKKYYPVPMEIKEIDIIKNHKTYSLIVSATTKQFTSVKTNFDILISSFKIG